MVIHRKTLQKNLWAVFFLFPSLAGMLIFMIIPMISSLVLTLYEWDPLIPTRFHFTGLQNYLTLIKDTNFWEALLHTLTYIAGYIPLVMVSGLAAALLMNQRLVGRAFFRGAIFMPVISAWVAVALMWTWIFNPKFGIVNYLLGLIGIAGPAWLYDPAWAMPAIILTSVWKDIGFIMVLFLTGLQNIPQEYYEAASIDGAGAWPKFLKITLPLLSPTAFFAMTISMISSFQVFDQVWIMTEGGPAGSTSVLVEQIVKNSFSYGRMGYAATLSWVLFLMVFLVTVFQTRMQKTWVTYD